MKPKMVPYVVAGWILGGVYRLVGATWRYRLHFHEGLEWLELPTRRPKRSVLFAHWHGDEMAMVRLATQNRVLTMSSTSKDGTMMTAALRTLGVTVERGSSTRGGVRALVALMHRLRREHFYVTFAIDGPRGPLHEAKPGIHMLAARTGAPIVQCLIGCRRRWDIPKAWNKAFVPKPFARIDLHLLAVPPATEENQQEILDLLNSRVEAPGIPPRSARGRS